MPRDRQEQFRNRLTTIQKFVLTNRMNLVNEQYLVRKLEDDLQKARRTRDSRILKLREYEGIQNTLINCYDQGRYPWGLPSSISLDQWFEMTEEKLDSSNK